MIEFRFDHLAMGGTMAFIIFAIAATYCVCKRWKKTSRKGQHPQQWMPMMQYPPIAQPFHMPFTAQPPCPHMLQFEMLMMNAIQDRTAFAPQARQTGNDTDRFAEIHGENIANPRSTRPPPRPKLPSPNMVHGTSGSNNGPKT